MTTRSHYIRCLQTLYTAANNSDNEKKPTWMQGHECSTHCQAFDRIVEDMGLDEDWLEVPPNIIPLGGYEKNKFGPMLRQTWGAIAGDAIMGNPDLEGSTDQPSDLEGIIEITLDANHPEVHGGMSHPEYERLLETSRLEDTRTWLRGVLNY